MFGKRRRSDGGGGRLRKGFREEVLNNKKVYREGKSIILVTGDEGGKEQKQESED